MTYPVTDDFAEKVRAKLAEGEEGWDAPNVAHLAHVMNEYLGEYEHGSVDVLDLFDDLNWTPESNEQGLKVMSNVLFDLLEVFALTDVTD
jgi:hypothetical protein